MTVTLGAPRDLDLPAFRRVAWDGEGERLASLACVQATRLAEDPSGLSASESVPEVALISMTALGWAEEARAAAGPAPG